MEEQPQEQKNENKNEEVQTVGFVYRAGDELGFHFKEGVNTNEILYFLESFVKVKRQEYESLFVPQIEVKE